MNLSHAIRADIEIIGNDGTHWQQDDIDNAVNYWKSKLYEAFDGDTVGETIYISTSTLFTLVSCMKAGWELGLGVFNQEFHGAQGNDTVKALEGFYDFIKVKLVHTDRGITDTHYKYVYLNEFDPSVKYPHRDYTLNKPVDENTVAVVTHTSGTTGVPKLIKMTHKQSIERINDIIELHGFTAVDVPAHYKILHHSSMFMDYSIPLMCLCKTHYSLEGVYAAEEGERDDPITFFNRVLPFLNENRVTQFLCPYEWANDMHRATHLDFDGHLSLYAIKLRTQNVVSELFEAFNFKEIGNGFGCSEFGRIAINKFTKDTAATFELNKYSTVNKNFEYEFFPTHTAGRIRGGEWLTTSDVFTTDGSSIYFHGRNQKLSVDGTEIDVGTLERKISDFFVGAHFSLVPDFELNKLYLARFDDLIPDDINNIIETEFELSNAYRIAKSDRLDIRRILRGAKPSNPLLLYYFRTNSA